MTDPLDDSHRACLKVGVERVGVIDHQVQDVGRGRSV
jgi:hypothetical protein